MMPYRFLRQENDRGATLVIVAGAMMLMLGMAAIAVDLSVLRFDLRADRLASDAAATAGVNAIDPLTGSNAVTACEVAWDYVLLNVADDESGFAPNCAAFATSCNPGVARHAQSTAGPYDITLTHPVPDDDPLMGSQAINPEVDGVPCQRFGVTVKRLRDFTFARVMGFDSGITVARSVARITPDVGEGDVVPLVILEPYDCEALTSPAGQGRITVTHFEDSPGVIVTDSDGSGNCGSSKPFIIDVKSVGNKRWIRALPVPGPDGARSAILSYALSGQPGTVPGNAYDPTDPLTPIDPTEVEDDGPPESWFQLYPQPQFRSQRVTRAPIDHRYDCRPSYPDYLGVPIAGCTNPEGGAHITALDSQYGSPPGNPPPGLFQRWTDFFPCTINEGTIEVTGNWWVNCGSPQGFIINPQAPPEKYELYTDASGGTFTLSDGTDTTSPIAFDASPTVVENTIQADIAAITDVLVTGAGTQADPWIIEFVDPDRITLNCDDKELTPTTAGCVLTADPVDAVVKFVGGNVVFENRVDIRAQGELHINPSPSDDHWVVIRAGNLLKRAQSTITLERTFVYVKNGKIDLGGGAGGLVWTAPIGGVFEDLALWSESSAAHEIGGQAGNTLTGTFFTPYSDPFLLTGQAGQFQTDAQFVTRKLEVKGQGKVLMAPDPERQTLIPVRGVLLIR